MSDQGYDQGTSDTSGQDQTAQQQSGMGQGQIDNLRQKAEGQIDQAIDQYAGKVPGGEQASQKAKDAAASGLDQIEKEAENRMGNMGGLGDMLGGNQGGQDRS